MKIIRC